MHRRQLFRERVGSAVAGISATVAEEWSARAPEDGRPLVVITARSEALEAAGGTMGNDGEGPADRRTLALTFEVAAEGATGLAAVDQVNDLDEEIGIALGVANSAGGILFDVCEDLRWLATEIEVATDQQRYIALATIIYNVTYDLFYGDPT